MARLSLGQPDHSGEGSLSSTTFVNNPGLGFVLVLAGAVLIGAPLGGVCTDEERNVYAEFPQYGNINKEPQPDAESGACVVYDTLASQEQVAEYYAQQLKAHGWTVQLSKGKAALSLPKENTKITVEQFSVNAHRDNCSYDVSFESHEMYDPPRPGAHVAVHIGKDSGKSPLVNEGHGEITPQPSE